MLFRDKNVDDIECDERILSFPFPQIVSQSFKEKIINPPPLLQTVCPVM